MKVKVVSFFLVVFSLFCFSASINISPAIAANSRLLFTPISGKYMQGESINVTLQASSETPFNVIGAAVRLTNLQVQSITPGTCNLTYVHAPTLANPSFTGAIFQTSSTNCSVYTLTMLPINQGRASLTLSAPELVAYATSRPLSVDTNRAYFSIVSSSGSLHSLSSPTSTHSSCTTFLSCISSFITKFI